MLGLSTSMRPGLVSVARAFSTTRVSFKANIQNKLAKADTGLPIPPKAPPNSYALFATDYYAADREKLSAMVKESGLGAIAVGLRDKWAAMSEEERGEYSTRAKKAREQYLKDFTKFLNELKPGQLDAIEKVTGQKIRFPGGRLKRREEARIASGEMAKPMSSFFLFNKHLHEKGELPFKYAQEGRQAIAKNARLSASRWKAMSDSEKEPWIAESAAYRAKYNAWKAENGVA